MPCWAEAVVLSECQDVYVASVRVKVGAALEEQAISECERLVEPGANVLSSVAVRAQVSQLYFDSYAIAVWTSAHAEWLACKREGMDEPPPPNMMSVPNAFTSLDLSELYSRRSHPKSCPKTTGPLLQLIARCTNPGARGWDPVLEQSLKTPGIRRIITREFEICLSGMHPQLHPALRPNWTRRFQIMRVAAHRLIPEATNADILQMAGHTKEVIRRLLASTMSNCMAMHVALSRLGHPVRHLNQPPMQLPHRGMEAAMAAFVASGMLIASTPDTTLYHAVTSKFTRAQRRIDGLQWVLGWLGKGTTDVVSRTTLIYMASDVWSATFKANFIAFWMHGMANKIRISRLDPIQHQALHEMNAVTRLCATLSLTDQLSIQRLVLMDPAAGTRTLPEAAAAMGIAVPANFPGNFKSAHDAISSISALGAEHAAMLFTYARVAWVKEHVFTVRLGTSVAQRQVQTLMRRMRRTIPPDCDDVVAYAEQNLPTHSTHLCVCTECQRVANAHVSNGVGDKPMGVFNEIGVSQSMIRWQNVGGTSGCLHCAKRSSAALRTAMTFQEYMKKRKLEADDVDEEAIDAIMTPRTATSVESGIAARVRRDAKNALEQRSVAAACGDSSMLTVPIIGKALRVYDAWYALCTYCAAVTRVTALHRYGSEICCLRCDHQVLYRKEDGDGLIERVAGQSVQKVCRYCGGVDPERSGARWKQIKSPLDVAGTNATLPAPLRRVHYCPLHYRCWIPGAHRVLPTRVILAHLATNAKPVCFAEQGEDGEPLPVAPKPSKARSKKRRIGGK